MKQKYALFARVLFGFFFFVFGLNGFLHFMPLPPMHGSASAFMTALVNTGYMLPLIKGTEVVAGFMLLTNMWAPLALIFLAPVIVNIALFHTLLAPDGLPIAIIIMAVEIFLAWSYRDRYASVLTKN